MYTIWSTDVGRWLKYSKRYFQCVQGGRGYLLYCLPTADANPLFLFTADLTDSKEPKGGGEGEGGKKSKDAPDLGPKMKYLGLTYEERNQYTMTSMTSGNLALFEVGGESVRG